VDRQVPVTRIDAADKSRVKSGVKIRVQGIRNAGSASVTRMTVQ
jgi:hypothetical protein